MNTATAILIATGMVCSTALILVYLVSRQVRRLIQEVLDQVKVQGRSVSVNIDKKINVEVGEDE
jgi:cell division protein FtsX